MIFVRLLPVVLSLLLLGAHYYRAGFISLVVITGGSAVILLLIRRPWVIRVMQVLLIVGGTEWLRTVISLVTARLSMGMPWVRLALILGGAALLSFCSIFILSSRSVRNHYKCD